jgi:hypothetical protein
MLSKSDDLTGRDIDHMNRKELIRMLLKYKDCVRTEVTAQWLDRQPTAWLRVLVLALQLYRVLQHQATCREAEGTTR